MFLIAFGQRRRSTAQRNKIRLINSINFIVGSGPFMGLVVNKKNTENCQRLKESGFAYWSLSSENHVTAGLVHLISPGESALYQYFFPEQSRVHILETNDKTLL